jgi:DNA-binding transcriptional MerR regulator
MLHVLAVEMTIDELARRTGTTTRNVRALQTAGVLLKPDMVGRTAHYGEVHVGRLSAVLRLQKDGFSIASIRALLEALADGRSLSEVLGLPDSSPVQGSADQIRADQIRASQIRAGHIGTGPSPDPFGDPSGPDMPDVWDPPRSESGLRHIRLLSDLPTTVLDLAI